MSLSRSGRPEQNGRGKRTMHPKKTSASRREWVSTVNDMSVYKLTPAELNYRHEIHKSHNKAAAQWDLRERALKKQQRNAGSPPLLDKTSLNIIKELLLQDVLAHSDRAMAVVKDLFGDAPCRQTGHPSITVAPKNDSDSGLPFYQRPDPPTQLPLLGQSVMAQQALHGLEDSMEDTRVEDAFARSPDLNIFQRTSVRTVKAKTQGKLPQKWRVNRHSSKQIQTDNAHMCTSQRASDQAALNATMAVRRLQSRQSQSEKDKDESSVMVSHVHTPELLLDQSSRISGENAGLRKHVARNSVVDGSSIASPNTDLSSLGLLQDMLGQVEDDLNDLCSETEPTSAHSPKQHRRQGLTGFSVALVSTLARLVQLLRQKEEKAQSAAQERRSLEDKLSNQQMLIDALTAEAMILRDLVISLQTELQQRTAEMELKLDTIVSAMWRLGEQGEHITSTENSDVKPADYQSAHAPEETQVSVSPAVLLSPPQQKDSGHQTSDTKSVTFGQEIPLVDHLCSCDKLSSAYSLISLPLTSLPSSSSPSLIPDSVNSQFDLEAILAENLQLGSQNDLIRAQLSQTEVIESGIGGSSRNSEDHISLSASRVSTGRILPHGTGQSKTLVSSGRETRTQHIQAAAAVQQTHQGTSNAVSASSLQQRLLDLNRQSAEARGRLLQLIEQQKPSDTGNPEVPVQIPAEERLSKASGAERWGWPGRAREKGDHLVC